MSCYNHQDIKASAHCGFCGKHLCKKCCDFSGGKASCAAPHCKEKIHLLEELNTRAARIYGLDKEGKPSLSWSGILFVIFGLILIPLDYFSDNNGFGILSIFSLFCILMGVGFIIRNRQYGLTI